MGLDGGAIWRQGVIPGLTRCTGARFDYAFDSWVSFGPGGNLYLSASVFKAAVLNDDRFCGKQVAVICTGGNASLHELADLANNTPPDGSVARKREESSRAR